MSKYNNIIKLGIALAFVAVCISYAVKQGWYSANYNLVNTHWIAMFGWLFALGLTLIYFLQDDLEMFRCVVYSSVIGISFGVLIQYMYENNIWFDTVITGDNTVWEVQLILLVLWVVVGIVKGVATNG